VKDDFPAKLSRAIRYSMDTVTNLLTQLNHPDHLLTRIGHPDRSDFRGVVADALQDNGRDSEADLLRSGKHVVVHEGKVKPGRWTHRPFEEHRNRLSAAIRAEGGWDEAHPPLPNGFPNHPRTFMPDSYWTGADDDDLDTWHADDLSQHELDENGIPMLEGSTFTCHDFQAPAHQAPKEWTDLLTDTMFDHRNGVLNHLPPDRRAHLEAIANEGHSLSLEEPVPEEGK
jgi:hypothetical protein